VCVCVGVCVRVCFCMMDGCVGGLLKLLSWKGILRCRKLNCLYCVLKAAVLCQFLEEVDYTTAFKSLGDIKSSTCSDAMDSFYSCIWDTTILEYLVYLHTKRGEHHRKQQAVSINLLIP
jgi:integrator complex subunit 8